jgi:hypothetical protein
MAFRWTVAPDLFGGVLHCVPVLLEFLNAMLVQVHLERRACERIKEHAGLIAGHHDMLADHDTWMKDHEKARREHYEWLAHIQAKLDALTDIVMRREGGPEAGR